MNFLFRFLDTSPDTTRDEQHGSGEHGARARGAPAAEMGVPRAQRGRARAEADYAHTGICSDLLVPPQLPLILSHLLNFPLVLHSPSHLPLP